jgi:hypothetical protein
MTALKRRGVSEVVRERVIQKDTLTLTLIQQTETEVDTSHERKNKR